MWKKWIDRCNQHILWGLIDVNITDFSQHAGSTKKRLTLLTGCYAPRGIGWVVRGATQLLFRKAGGEIPHEMPPPPPAPLKKSNTRSTSLLNRAPARDLLLVCNQIKTSPHASSEKPPPPREGGDQKKRC